MHFICTRFLPEIVRWKKIICRCLNVRCKFKLVWIMPCWLVFNDWILERLIIAFRWEGVIWFFLSSQDSKRLRVFSYSAKNFEYFRRIQIFISDFHFLLRWALLYSYLCPKSLAHNFIKNVEFGSSHLHILL